MTRRGMTLAVSSALLLLLLVAAALLPVPYIALTPGPLYDTIGKTGDKQVIEVSGRKAFPPKTGHLYLTTISVQGAPGYPKMTLLEAMKYWADPAAAVVPREVEYPPGRDVKEVDARTKEQMVESQDAAKIAALRFLGEKVTTAGIIVSTVEEGMPANGQLQPKDQLKSVDGIAVTSATDLRDRIRTRTPGDVVRIGYARNGVDAVAEIKTVAAQDGSGRAIIGIGPAEKCPCSTPFDVKISLGENVGGPSAGLMFSLGILDTLTPGELTGGLTIAGTGTMDVDGQVGPIGGIKQKLIAAKRKGAVAFLVPEQNWAAAQESPPAGLALYKVATLGEAVEKLCSVTKAPESPCNKTTS